MKNKKCSAPSLRKSNWCGRRLLQKLIVLSFVICHLFLSVACYNHRQQTPDAWNLTEKQIDSISFFTTHHYTQGYNFVVNADTMMLCTDEQDSVTVKKDDRLVVADINIHPQDSIDSVWVKVARDQLTQGWIRENEMLQGVSPDDPISQFIDFFSNSHLLIFLAFFVIAGAIYGLFRLNRRHAYIVHFHDIGSFYPTLLCLLVASSATLYASIQMFGPETWRHFYYHPSLNPFALPPVLGLFVTSVWAMIIVGVAVLFDLYRRLTLSNALLYIAGLAAVCAINYIVFSLTTLWYIGYPLLLIYVAYALWRCHYISREHYICGNCGRPLSSKGICPYCGALNE